MKRTHVDCYCFAIYFLLQQYETVLQRRLGQVQWVWLFSALLSLEDHTPIYPREETERHNLIVNLCLLLFCSPNQISYVRSYKKCRSRMNLKSCQIVSIEAGVATGGWLAAPVSRRNSEIHHFQKSLCFGEGNRWMKKFHVRKTVIFSLDAPVALNSCW